MKEKNKEIISYFLPYKFFIGVSLISSIMVAGSNLVLPLVVKNLIDKVLIQKNLAILNIISIFIVLLFLGKGIFYYTQNYFSQKIAINVINRLKKELYAHMILLPYNFFKNEHSGTITSYIINDLNLIQSILSTSFFNGILDLLIVAGSILFLFIINFKLALLSFILLPFLAFIINRIGRVVRNLTKGIQGKMAELTSHISDSLSGISVIFTFSTQEKEKERFNKIADETMALSLKDSKLRALLPPLVELFLSFGLTFVLWFGGRDVIKGNMTSGDLIAFLGYLVLASSPLSRLSNAYYSLKKLQGAFERLFEFLGEEKVEISKTKSLTLPYVKGKIEFKDVSFSYEGRPILSNLNFTILPGEKVALIGPNGQGKTTLLHLILRLFEPLNGKILLDNVDIKDIDLYFLRSHIGMVLQDTHLFPGTIYDNIVYGIEEVSEKKLDTILKELKFDNILNKLPHGIYTDIGEEGARLSGGERHRISLARTLMLDPEILLLDEPTASLDPISRREFQMFLKKVMDGRTTIFITHYKEEIEMADKVFLVKDQKVNLIPHSNIDEFFTNGY